MSRPFESEAARRKRAVVILRILRKEFPERGIALAHENAFQLLLATILSAQCTDVRVNMVTPALFRKYRSPHDFASADQAELERDIKSTGFFRMKAKNLIACSKAIMEQHGGRVPETMDELVQLPGVGRKTANVVLGQAFGISSGIVVDTHVQRVSRRLALTDAEDPVKIEADLMKVFDKPDWINVGMLLIYHGRRTCVARKPKCESCLLAPLCPSAGIAG